MTKKTTLFIALSVLTAIAGAAAAQTDGDSLRCEARKMRAESQYYACQSRCDRRADRSSARPAASRRADAPGQDCDAVCTQHFDDDMTRIGGKAPCATIVVPPNPQECEARTLRLSAANLRCQVRCGREHREGHDPSDCRATCATRCGTTADELMADPVCHAGRIGESEACAIH